MDTQFCYYCRVDHPRHRMRLFMTRQGPRWRCLETIIGTRASQAERDAFGQRQSALNQQSRVPLSPHLSRLRHAQPL